MLRHMGNAEAKPQMTGIVASPIQRDCAPPLRLGLRCDISRP